MTLEQENVYLQRVNHVFNHIRTHLTGDLSLEALAKVAHFSPFHFHRIFKALTGETLNQCVNRLRLERSVQLLKASPRLNLIDIALDCGFSSASSFSRAFKIRYNIAPSEWDRHTPLADERKIRQVFADFPQYTAEMLDRSATRQPFSVEIRQLPAQTLAYIRVMDSYNPENTVSAYERLHAWYTQKTSAPTTLYGMSQDDPDITPMEQCRFDWCYRVPDDWQEDGEITIQHFPACKLAVVRCDGDIFAVDRTWKALFNIWLPRSRYQPANLPAMEIYRREPADIGWEHYALDCAIPIVTL